jgi:pilus assembly protein CpaB
MARVRAFIVLVLAVTVGGALAFGTYSYVQRQPLQTVKIPTQPVIVAAADLEIGAELKAEDLRVIEWPESAVPMGAFHKPDELVGRGLILPVIQNEPILPMKVAAKDAGAGLPPIIPTGMRALSVRVNDVIGVAGYVLPGTRVDVVATVNPGQQQTEITSKVIMTNVQVLAAGTKVERDEKNKPTAVAVVTLLVDPDQAERLTLASTEGKIQLALRNPLDRTAPETRGIRSAGLLGAVPAQRPALVARATKAPAPGAPAVAPPPQPQSEPTVEIIRGDKRAREIVREQ